MPTVSTTSVSPSQLPDRVTVVARRHLVDRQLRLVHVDPPHLAERLGDDRDLRRTLDDLRRIERHRHHARKAVRARTRTAGVASGSPVLIASSSAARRASYRSSRSALQQIGVGGGGVSFGSAPRPPRYGAHDARQIRRRGALRGEPAIARQSRTSAAAARRDDSRHGWPPTRPGPLPSTRPSRSVMRTSSPPGSPLRSGLSTTVILSSGLDVGELPAGLHQDARAAQLDAPVLDGALVVGNVDLDVGVRIGPLERGDRSGHRHALRRVEHGERVMREERASPRDRSRDQRQSMAAEARITWPFSFAAFSSARAALRMLRSP